MSNKWVRPEKLLNGWNECENKIKFLNDTSKLDEFYGVDESRYTGIVFTADVDNGKRGT